MPSSLLASLASHARFFDQLANMIPVKHYASDETEVVNLKYLKKNKREEAKRSFKEQYKQNKKRKLDPDTAITTITHMHTKPLQGDAKGGDARKEGKRASSRKRPSASTGSSLSREPTLSRDELKERLQARIEAVRKERNLQASQEAAKSAKQWRQQQLEANATKRKLRQTETSRDSTPQATPSASKASGHNSDAAQPQAAAGVPAADDINFTFGKVDLGQGKHSRYKKKLTPEQVLKQAEERQKEMEKLKAMPEAKEKVKEQMWSSVLMRARGEKVLDNPKLLKKAMKRQAKQKEKSTAAWKERTKQQAAQMNAKQQKRKDSLEHRRVTKFEHKKAKREKKLLGPGFEGRKQGFIGGTSSS